MVGCLAEGYLIMLYQVQQLCSTKRSVKMIVNGEWGSNWTETVVAYLKVLYLHSHGSWRNPRCPGRDSNRIPSQEKSKEFPLCKSAECFDIKSKFWVPLFHWSHILCDLLGAYTQTDLCKRHMESAVTNTDYFRHVWTSENFHLAEWRGGGWRILEKCLRATRVRNGDDLKWSGPKTDIPF